MPWAGGRGLRPGDERDEIMGHTGVPGEDHLEEELAR
jgi:hypothetical protein